MAIETWLDGQSQEVEACFRKNNNKKKTYQLIMTLTIEKSTTLQGKSGGSASQRSTKSLTDGHITVETFTSMRLMMTTKRCLTFYIY